MASEVIIPDDLLCKMPPCASEMPSRKYTWLSNEEVAAILTNFKKQGEWMTLSRVYRPENGRLLMFNRKKVKYRQDMYMWKTKRKSKWLREDHVKLKVGGVPCITALYVHSDILPTFHRRCYWFVQNPDVVLVHYLNFPYTDDKNHVTRDFSLNHQCQQWQDLAKEDVIEQLRPMFANMPWPRSNAPSLTFEQGELIIKKLVDKHFLEIRSQFVDPWLESVNRGLPRNIQPKASDGASANSVASSQYTNPGTNNPLLTTVTTYQVVSNGCVPKNVVAQPVTINHALNTNPTNCAVILLSNGAVQKCSAVQTDTDNSNGVRHVPVSSTPAITNTINCDPRKQLILQQTNNETPDNTGICSDKNGTKAVASPSIVLSSSPLPNPSLPHQSEVGLKIEEWRLTNSCPKLETHLLHPNVQLTNNKSVAVHRSEIKEDTTQQKPASSSQFSNFRQSDYNQNASDFDSPSPYGVKDAMVTTCRMAPFAPEYSPFTDAPTNHTLNSGLGLDVFDVESLFNVSTSTSVESASSDQANSSTESAVGDLFPQHLWESNITTSDTVGSVTPDSGQECIHTSNNNHQYQSVEHYSSDSPHNITDFSPDWAYTEGGVKVLIAGTWINDGDYQCVFGKTAVPATNLQIGVLRCFCPAHEPGQVDLLVKCDGLIVSHPVQFEYKPIPSQYQSLTTNWLQLNENEFKMSILDRLEKVEDRLNSMGSKRGNVTANEDVQMSSRLQYGLNLGLDRDASLPQTQGSLDFEDRLINICWRINNIALSTPQNDLGVIKTEGLTLLHYSAALGYTKLINSLRSLWSHTGNAFLLSECDTRNVDKYDCTPLMWASACGQLSSAESLCMWSSNELRCLDVLGRSPATVAKQRGHINVFNRLESIGESRGLLPPEQDEVDDADISSIGDTTISGTLDTIDSGEDSMETDDNLSFDQLSTPASRSMFVSPLADHGNETDTLPSSSQTDNRCNKENIDWEDGQMLIDGNSECVTSLAEQILEHAPDYVKGNNATRSPNLQSDESDLTLRNLPQFVNSHCGSNFYPSSSQCGEQGSLLNWSEFLRLPPRDLSPSNVYQNSFELQLDSLRLTEHEQRQLFIAATTVINAYHCEGLALNSEVLRASLLIQGCYRKYKKHSGFPPQFAMSKKMNEAAVLIQSKFRSYQEQKRFQRSRHAAILIQSFYRTYKYARCGKSPSGRSSKQTVKLIEDALRGHMTKKRQHQAARKIQRFLRRCQFRLRQQDMTADARSLSTCMKEFYAC
uniref:Calmodulin-binding transcription activator 2-like n=1 Tax=Phallusia mammillata TaxID=59560 RepID=A0A6F9D8G7_9ASCI|nr:calmodulin-binding transcription activator 2-like [Phallusia mammillata]